MKETEQRRLKEPWEDKERGKCTGKGVRERGKEKIKEIQQKIKIYFL